MAIDGGFTHEKPWFSSPLCQSPKPGTSAKQNQHHFQRNSRNILESSIRKFLESRKFLEFSGIIRKFLDSRKMRKSPETAVLQASRRETMAVHLLDFVKPTPPAPLSHLTLDHQCEVWSSWSNFLTKKTKEVKKMSWFNQLNHVQAIKDQKHACADFWFEHGMNISQKRTMNRESNQPAIVGPPSFGTCGSRSSGSCGQYHRHHL